MSWEGGEGLKGLQKAIERSLSLANGSLQDFRETGERVREEGRGGPGFQEPWIQGLKEWGLALHQVAAGAVGPRGVLRALDLQTRLSGPPWLIAPDPHLHWALCLGPTLFRRPSKMCLF